MSSLPFLHGKHITAERSRTLFFLIFLCRTCAAYIIFVASDHAHLDMNIVEIGKFGVFTQCHKPSN